MTAQPALLHLGVIDADSGFVRPLANRLETAGWRLRLATGSMPPGELVELRLDALLVDPACLGPAGSAYLEQVCEAVPALGVVVCTGPSGLAERVRGLRLGADDWVTKPCHPEEVIARLEAVSRRRRRGAAAEPGALAAGDLEVRTDRFQAFVAGRSVDLTRREFELLRVLVEAHGQVLDRDEIYERVWGYAMAHGDRSVDVFVRKLRQKIERCAPGTRYIHTHFGVGYRFEPEPEPHAERQPAPPSRAEPTWRPRRPADRSPAG